MKMSSETLPEYSGVLLCGGKGSRIETITKGRGGVPKPLLEVNGKPLVRHTIDLMPQRHIPELIFTVGHKAEQMRNWITSSGLPYEVKIAQQTRPGALSAMLDAMPYVERDRAIVSNADEIRNNLNLEKALQFHQRLGRLATLVTAYANNLARHRVVERRADGLVIGTVKQPEKYRNKPETIGLVNTGMIILDRRAMDYTDYNHDIDWSGLLDPLSDAGQLGAYIATNIDYFNVGTPEEYFEAEAFLRQQPREVYP